MVELAAVDSSRSVLVGEVLADDPSDHVAANAHEAIMGIDIGGEWRARALTPSDNTPSGMI
jgi:hypothetical protein